MTYYHQHPKTDFNSPNHTYKGSLIRHIAIERAFAKLEKPLAFMFRKTHSLRAYRLLKFPYEIVFGLNMNLPKEDVIKYVVFEYLGECMHARTKTSD